MIPSRTNLIVLTIVGCVGVAGCAGARPWPWLAADVPAAESGPSDADGQYQEGLRHLTGEGVAQDYAVAARWFEEAAAQGHAEAQYMLGVAYYAGRGVDQDHRRAVSWFTKAAEQGHSAAQFELGDAFANGRGVAKDAARAVHWTGSAAWQGHREAQFATGVALAASMGVARDDVEAAMWLRLAAGAGHQLATRVLAAVESRLSPADSKRAQDLAGAWTPIPAAGLTDAASVRAVQQALAVIGFDPGPIDGVPGPRTRRAVAKYREARGLIPGTTIAPDLVRRLERDLAVPRALAHPSRNG